MSVVLLGSCTTGKEHAETSSPKPTSATPTPSLADASLETFAALWVAHTRSLRIDRSGRGFESIDDGCCSRVVDLTFKIDSVVGTEEAADAYVTVTSIEYASTDLRSRLRVGDEGKLYLRGHEVISTLTGANYCGDNPPPPDITVCGA